MREQDTSHDAADQEPPAPERIRCALLDERDVYVGIVEIAPWDATTRHLTAITDCDLPVGEYRWDRERHTFVPLPAAQRARAGRPTLEHALAFDLLARWERGDELPSVCLAWFDDALRTVDFGAVLSLESVQRYIVARGLDLTKKD